MKNYILPLLLSSILIGLAVIAAWDMSLVYQQEMDNFLKNCEKKHSHDECYMEWNKNV